MTLRVAIFGIGAMGSLFGARLAPLADVTLIGHWTEQLKRLRRHPIRVFRADGSSYESRVKVIDYGDADPDSPLLKAFENNPADIALILTKAGKTAMAAVKAAQILKLDGIAISLQNGVGNYETLQEHVGDNRAALATTTQGAAMVEPGVVKEGGAGLTHLAVRPEIAPQVRSVAELLARAGFVTEVVADVRGLVWGKLAINAAINPLTALLRVPNGKLLVSPEIRKVMGEAAREVAAVAAAQGIELPFSDPAARAEEVARLTGANQSSMLQDVQRGAPTEIEAMCGAVVREGQRFGIPTPVNALLYQLIKGLEATNSDRI